MQCCFLARYGGSMEPESLRLHRPVLSSSKFQTFGFEPAMRSNTGLTPWVRSEADADRSLSAHTDDERTAATFDLSEIATGVACPAASSQSMTWATGSSLPSGRSISMKVNGGR